MASKDYLFVNKDSRSPSLSRNTGTEASLASRVNKHVQQQRFWRASGPRRSWYRPFVRSDSTSSAPSPAGSDPAFLEDVVEPIRRLSHEQRSPKLIRRSISTHHSSPGTSRKGSGSLPQDQAVIKEDLTSLEGKWPIPSELTTQTTQQDHGPDLFNTSVIPLTPLLVEVIQRQLEWAVAASLSDHAVQDGVDKVFAVVLQDKMHATAFLAMATAQQRRTGDLTFPHNQSPELYSYRATKLIREHLERQKGPISPYTIVDIFRLAMCEWMTGNRDAARIHLAYVSKSWKTFTPQTSIDHHILEVCSTEDIFLAIDVDSKPLLDLTWEPDLPIGPHPIADGNEVVSAQNLDSVRDRSLFSEDNRGNSARLLEKYLEAIHPPIAEILSESMTGLSSFPRFSSIDFGSALTGPMWVMKRRMQAAMHRLQNLELEALSTEESIRRALVIVLLFASTTSLRRTARTNMTRLAIQLQISLENLEALRSVEEERDESHPLHDPCLWLWMYIVGLTAAKESSSQETVRQWFTKRVLLLTVQIFGPFVTLESVERILADYFYLNTVLGKTVEALCSSLTARNNSQTNPVTTEDRPNHWADSPG